MNVLRKYLVDKLVEKNEDINLKDKFGKTALMYASEIEDNINVKNLVDKKANINLQDRSGKTALMYASKIKNNERVVKYLKNKLVNIKNSKIKIILNPL